MDNIVAARRLRKSMLKDVSNIELDTFNYYSKRDIYNEEIMGEENKNKKNKILSFKNKLLIKIFLSVTIVFVSLVIKLSLYDDVKDTKVIKFFVTQYNINYEKSDVINCIEKFFRNNKKVISYIIPAEICEYVKSIYYINFKDNYLN